MNAQEILVTAAILIMGTVLNYGYAIIAGALSIPLGIEFVIVAYCLVVMVFSLRLAEVVAIGICSGILNILSSPAHVTTIVSGQAASSAGLMALVNLASEPAGIVICFFSFTYLVGRIRTGAPFAAAFAATIASGLVYLVIVTLLNPGHITDWPAYTENFLIRVDVAAVANAFVTGLLFHAMGRVLKKSLADHAG